MAWRLLGVASAVVGPPPGRTHPPPAARESQDSESLHTLAASLPMVSSRRQALAKRGSRAASAKSLAGAEAADRVGFCGREIELQTAPSAAPPAPLMLMYLLAMYLSPIGGPALPEPRVTLLTFLLAFWLAFLLASSRTALFRSIGYPCEFKHLSVGKLFAMSLIFAANVPSEMPTRAPVRGPIPADERTP